MEGVKKAPGHISTQYLHPHKTRKKAVTLVLSEEMERDIGEWYESHPLLYDKGYRDHLSSVRMTGKLSVDQVAVHSWPFCSRIASYVEP